MVEVIVARDAEALAVTFLRGELGARGVAAMVATKVPAKMPAKMVRVSRAGGSARNIAYDQPLLLVECWATSGPAASDLAALTRGLMLAWASLSDDVTMARDGGGFASLPDPDTNNPRYQFAVQVDMKMSAI